MFTPIYCPQQARREKCGWTLSLFFFLGGLRSWYFLQVTCVHIWPFWRCRQPVSGLQRPHGPIHDEQMDVKTVSWTPPPPFYATTGEGGRMFLKPPHWPFPGTALPPSASQKCKTSFKPKEVRYSAGGSEGETPEGTGPFFSARPCLITLNEDGGE